MASLLKLVTFVIDTKGQKLQVTARLPWWLGYYQAQAETKTPCLLVKTLSIFIEVTGLLFPLSIQTMQPAWHSLLGSQAGQKGLLRDAFCGPIQWGFPQGPLLWLHQLASSSAYRRTFRQLQVPHICGPFWLGGISQRLPFGSHCGKGETSAYG